MNRMNKADENFEERSFFLPRSRGRALPGRILRLSYQDPGGNANVIISSRSTREGLLLCKIKVIAVGHECDGERGRCSSDANTMATHISFSMG